MKFSKMFLSLNYFKRAVALAFSHQIRQDNKSIKLFTRYIEGYAID